MWFAFFVSLLAFAIAIRMFEFLFGHKFFSISEIAKIGSAYLLTVFLFVIILPHTHRGVWLGVCVPLLIAAGAAYALVRTRAQKFRGHFRETLAVISLKMKSGRSFRHALSEACNDAHPRFRSKLLEIANAVVFSQQSETESTNSFISEVIEELTRIDQSPHSAMKRLSVYRQKLRMEDDFRRRSGQVLSKIRAQSIVMSGLYIAVFAFMVWKFGWSSNAAVLIISALLFSVGAAWIYFGGRKLRWKV